MKEAGLRGRACVLPGILAGLGMVGMGLVSDNVVRADTTTVTDSINVTVLPSCTFISAQDKDYFGSAANGAEVEDFTEQGIHEFNIFCNNHSGFTVTATAEDLSADDISEKITYTNNYTHEGPSGMWTAQIDSDTEGVTVVDSHSIPAGASGGTIISSDSNTRAGGASFTATYKAYVGTITPAGTYAGTVIYTLAANGTPDDNTQHSSNTGGSSGTTEPGGETETPGGEDTGNTETPDQQTGGNTNGDQQSGGSDASGTNSLTPTSNTTSLNTTNTTNHTTYNTYNTYNTTNYGGATTPVSMPTTVATATGDSTDSSTTDDTATTPVADNANTATTDYQKPLGVTSSTSTKSTANDSMDPMPIVATGAITAAVVAGVALASSGRKEEK